MRGKIDAVNLEYYFGQEATVLFDLLAEQITLALRHDCIRHQLPCVRCEERGQDLALRFMRNLPQLRAVLAKDVRAAYEGDPAAGSYDEIIFSYPGLSAITTQRIAHLLLEQAQGGDIQTCEGVGRLTRGQRTSGGVRQTR